MNEINYILNDESNNDKQLVKELSTYIKNHKNKNLPINKKFIKDVLDILLRNSEVEYNKISLTDEIDNIAEWIPEYLQFNFNTTYILNIASKIKKELGTKVGDNNLFKYTFILVTIIHEFTHARQDYVALTDNNNIYISNNNFCDEYYEPYLQHHDHMLIERYANLRSWTLTYEVLSCIYPITQIRELRIYIFSYLFEGYKIITNEENNLSDHSKSIDNNEKIVSALDTYNEIMEDYSVPKINIDSTKYMTLYDRLYLGLPITLSEYQKLEELYNSVYSNDISKDENVKKLINKL